MNGYERFTSEDTLSARPDKRRLYLYVHRYWIICIALHVCVVTLYLTLFTLYGLRVERRFIVALEDSSKVSSYLNAILQALVTLTIAAMVAVAQPLAIQRQLQKTQTLTALADKSSAWAGLGSSFIVLWHNLKFSATAFSVFKISIYFACLAVLHTTTPILFSITITTAAQNTYAQTIIGTPTLYYNQSYLQTELGSAMFQNLSVDWYTSSVSIGLFGTNTVSQPPGLRDNRVFDTLAATTTVNGTAQVNYTDFNVKCGMVPEANVSTVPSIPLGTLNISVASNGVEFNMSDFLFVDGFFGLGSVWFPSDVVLRVPTASSHGRNVLLYSTYATDSNQSSPIYDSRGSSGSSFPVVLDTETFYVQVIGCTVTTSNGTAKIDSTTNNLSPDNEPAASTANPTWEAWEFEGISGNLLEDTWGSIYDPRSSISVWDPNNDITFEWSCSDHPNLVNCHIPTLVEKYLSDAVFGPSSTFDGVVSRMKVHTNFTNANLGQLEAAMGRVSATLMWTAARAGALTSAAVVSGDSLPYTSNPQTGQTILTTYPQIGQLQLNVVPLALGTASSLMLFVLAFLLLRPTSANAKSEAGELSLQPENTGVINNLGFLQTISMMEGTPLYSRLAHIGNSEGDVSNLRRAGMFDVAIENGKLMPVELTTRRKQVERDAAHVVPERLPLVPNIEDPLTSGCS